MQRDEPNKNANIPQNVRAHYIVERELADRLRNAGPEERKQLYASLYDELFQRVPCHSQVTVSTETRKRKIDIQMRLLKRFLHPDATMVEIGPGDCALSFEAARHVAKVYGVDVSREITAGRSAPDNFELCLYQGVEIPLPDGVADLVFSDQLIEHLHPDDARQQLVDIRRILKPGGAYLCLTPNRLSGPHDISKHFDTEATGFHLKEYTNMELAGLMRQAGFRHVGSYAALKGHFSMFPMPLAKAVETLLLVLPHRLRKRLAGGMPCRAVLGIHLIAER